jgi:protocatechuate 3,4-dioxygenase beta subunit
MDRKKFLMTASFAAFSISTFGRTIKLNDGFAGDCDTTNDILGPFYRPDAPIRQDLTFQGQSGSIVELKGRVFKSDCITPLVSALVEIWHCNTEGKYDNNSEKFHQRASWYTNEEGENKFKTILPGKYLNGEQFRPAHIHFRVTEKNSKELISQIYFKGDPHITKDPWASQKKAELRILPIILENTMGDLKVNFDIYLKEK